MQSPETFYVWGWPEYSFIAILLIGWIVLVYTNKAPSVNSIRDFVNVWNSRGGNIVVLVGLTVYAIHTCMRFMYHIVIWPKMESSIRPMRSFRSC